MTLAAHLDRRQVRGRPYAAEQEVSLDARMQKGRMPRDLSGLLRWYAEGWDAEVPVALHRSEVWRDHGTDAEGGSRLGSPALTDPFRRYMRAAVEVPSQSDEDGWYLLPMHAALARLGRRWPLTARVLFAVAQSGYDWRGVGTRLHYADEMMTLWMLQALAQLWAEHRDEVVRLQ